MYSAASSAFHKAVAEGESQIALLIFEDAVFTNEDINVEEGIKFDDYFNMEEDIAIGQTLSNEISFGLFNDDRLLNNYEFGDFLATIGVLTSTDSYTQAGNVKIITNNAEWVGYSDYPFIKRAGLALSTQPSFAVKALLGYDNKVYAFADSGAFAVYNDKTGENITSSIRLNAFMKDKGSKWAARNLGMFYNKSSRKLSVFEEGDRYWYEFVPLGWFTAERPKSPDKIQINMTCNDFMVKFDEDMPSAKTLGISYPVTFSNLFKAMCDYLKVNYRTNTFINSSAKITKEPDAFKNTTMREVLKWLAEAAASNAKFDRDGYLIFDWLHDTDQAMDEGDYESFDPYWYRTKTITKLTNRGSDGSYSASKGSGSQTYLIQDNPLLKGVT